MDVSNSQMAMNRPTLRWNPGRGAGCLTLGEDMVALLEKDAAAAGLDMADDPAAFTEGEGPFE